MILEENVLPNLIRTSLVQTSLDKKSEGGLRFIAVVNTFRRLSAKCVGTMSLTHVKYDMKVDKYVLAPIGSHVFLCLNESPSPKKPNLEN